MIPVRSSAFPERVSHVDQSWLTATTHHETPYTRYGKRIFDIAVALFTLFFILSWLLPIIGLAVVLTSPGPPLYIQERMGRRGRTFRCFKFRTMYHAPGQSFKQAQLGDLRITKIGRWLRRTNLDEMPQFLNVLSGEMSVVGPRPHAVEHDRPYWGEIHNYHFRYTVRPGITGLAQVRGSRGDTSLPIKMKHRLRYDLHYMKRQSLWFDFLLCWLTLKQMLLGSGNRNAW